MVQVYFENWFAVGHRLASCLHDPSHLRAHIIFTDSQTCRRVRKPVGCANFFDLFLQLFTQSIQELLMLALIAFRIFFLIISVTELEFSTTNITKLHPVEFTEMSHQPFIDGIT